MCQRGGTIQTMTKHIELYSDATFVQCTVKDGRTTLITNSKRIKHVCINDFPGEYKFDAIIRTKKGKSAKFELIEPIIIKEIE